MLTTLAHSIHDLISAEQSAALNGTIPIFPTLRIESTTIAEFDIMDKKPTIIQVVGKGAATYHNASGRTISIFDYENFVNNLHPILQKNERRPDFIAIDNNASKIVINELSTGNPKSKKIGCYLSNESFGAIIEKVINLGKRCSHSGERMCLLL